MAVLAAAAVLAAPGSARTQLLLSRDEALELVFPPPAHRVERRTAFLDDGDLARARELAGPDVPVDDRVVSYYVGLREGDPVGVAYFDAHRVRTLPEVVMVAVDPEGRIRRMEVLRFSEPPEYRAPEGWIDQLEERRLDDELSLRGAIVGMTGATLTSRALTRAARRVLALHRVIDPYRVQGGDP